jgi:hypothetical protein
MFFYCSLASKIILIELIAITVNLPAVLHYYSRHDIYPFGHLLAQKSAYFYTNYEVIMYGLFVLELFIIGVSMINATIRALRPGVPRIYNPFSDHGKHNERALCLRAIAI